MAFMIGFLKLFFCLICLQFYLFPSIIAQFTTGLPNIKLNEIRTKARVEETITQIDHPSNVLIYKDMIFMTMFRVDKVFLGIMGQQTVQLFADGAYCQYKDKSQHQNNITGNYHPMTCGVINGPWGMAIYNNNIYISSFGSDQILIFNIHTKEFITSFGDSDHLDCPEGIAIDSSREIIYIVNYNNNEIVEYHLHTLQFIRVLVSQITCSWLKGIYIII